MKPQARNLGVINSSLLLLGRTLFYVLPLQNRNELSLRLFCEETLMTMNARCLSREQVQRV